MNLNEALATLTHVCVQRPGLKLNPSQCEKRRKIGATHMNPMALFQPGIECQECPGPIPIFFDPANPQPKPKESGKMPPPKPNLKKSHECNCGEMDPKKFYPSNKSKCKKCLYESQQKSRRIESIPPPVPISDPTIMHTEEQAVVQSGNGTAPEDFKYHCDLHGPHNGHYVGAHFTPRCKQCVQLNRSRGIIDTNHQRFYLNTSGYAFVKQWLIEESARIKVDPEAMLLKLVVDRIPSEFIKDFFLNQ